MRVVRKQKNQDGMIAIMMATIIMVILSLITIGFARLMQREQRQALDRSLSTQAFYAAESGVNEVVSKIRSGDISADEEKTSCTSDTTGANLDGRVDASLASSYSCLLIDQTPISLEYNDGAVSTGVSKVVPIKGRNNEQINTINIAWSDPLLKTTNSSLTTTPLITDCPSGSPSLPNFASWSTRTPGMLRVDLIPTHYLERNTLFLDTISFFLYPVRSDCGGTGMSTTSYSNHHGNAAFPMSSESLKGQIVPVRCSATLASGRVRTCEIAIRMDIGRGTTNGNSATVSGSLAAAPAGTSYVLRAKSVYRNSDMTVRLFDNSGQQLETRGAQVLIDSTGKVGDVLRRVQVRVPTNESRAIPEYVLQTTSTICKQLQLTPTSATDGCGAYFGP